MRAFEVFLNGKKLCVAGVKEGVLSTIIDAVSGRNELHLHVGGLQTATDEHVRWRSTRLKVGDSVQITVVDTPKVDRPRQRYKRDPAMELREAKRFARYAAKKYGWKISIPSKKKGKARS